MAAAAQRGIRRQIPDSVIVNLRRRDLNAVIVQPDGIARFAAAAQRRERVVGGLAADERAGRAAVIITDAVNYRCYRGGRINVNGKGRRGRSGIAGGVGRRYGKVMHSLRQRRCRRKAPLAVFVHGGAADGDTVIEDLHAGVWFSAAAERRTRIVRCLTRGERTGYAARIVRNGVQDRRLRPAEIHYQGKAR